jgi:hypothetical protein
MPTEVVRAEPNVLDTWPAVVVREGPARHTVHSDGRVHLLIAMSVFLKLWIASLLGYIHATPNLTNVMRSFDTRVCKG